MEPAPNPVVRDLVDFAGSADVPQYPGAGISTENFVDDGLERARRDAALAIDEVSRPALSAAELFGQPCCRLVPASERVNNCSELARTFRE